MDTIRINVSITTKRNNIEVSCSTANGEKIFDQLSKSTVTCTLPLTINRVYLINSIKGFLYGELSYQDKIETLTFDYDSVNKTLTDGSLSCSENKTVKTSKRKSKK